MREGEILAQVAHFVPSCQSTVAQLTPAHTLVDWALELERLLNIVHKLIHERVHSPVRAGSARARCNSRRTSGEIETKLIRRLTREKNEEERVALYLSGATSSF